MVSIFCYFLILRNLKPDDWIGKSNLLRQILEKKIDQILNASPNEMLCNNLRQYRVRVLEKEINVACGNYFKSCLFLAYNHIFYLLFKKAASYSNEEK